MSALYDTKMFKAMYTILVFPYFFLYFLWGVAPQYASGVYVQKVIQFIPCLTNTFANLNDLPAV